MTAVGRFSLKSETEHNRSIPTFFLALSGEKNYNTQLDSSANTNPSSRHLASKLATGMHTSMHNSASSSSSSSSLRSNQNNIFTVSDFEDAWLSQDMPLRHPRFHSTVCPQQHYFEEKHHILPSSSSSSSAASSSEGKQHDKDVPSEDPILQIKAELHNHASETMHYSIYRHDLRNRLEHMLTSPMNVSEKLWEVQISNGKLGSSGAISRAKVDVILKKMNQSSSSSSSDKSAVGDDLDDAQMESTNKSSSSSGVWWNTNTHRANRDEKNTIPMESVLLFRSHHALADGASIMAALSDLCDEAEEIRAEIQLKLNNWKQRGKGQTKSFFRRLLSRILRLLKICAWITFGTLHALLYQGYLQIATPRNPFDAVRRDAERKGFTLHGRSISWCDAAPLEEVKQIAKVISNAKGMEITVNDLFVSCVTSAVTRQLIEHEEFMSPMDAHKRRFAVPSINVVVPVHLRGGVLLPGESVGNNIGAFVTRCPGEMNHDAVGGGIDPCPTERLVKVHKSLLYSKRSPAPFVSHYIAKFCSTYLPDGVTQRIFQCANANAAVVVSNTRGYDKKMHIKGMTVESAAGFLPLPPGIPIGVVVQSYAGVVSLSVTAEKWAVPDADKFLRWVLDEYQRLHEATARVQG